MSDFSFRQKFPPSTTLFHLQNLEGINTIYIIPAECLLFRRACARVANLFSLLLPWSFRVNCPQNAKSSFRNFPENLSGRVDVEPCKVNCVVSAILHALAPRGVRTVFCTQLKSKLEFTSKRIN